MEPKKHFYIYSSLLMSYAWCNTWTRMQNKKIKTMVNQQEYKFCLLEWQFWILQKFILGEATVFNLLKWGLWKSMCILLFCGSSRISFRTLTNVYLSLSFFFSRVEFYKNMIAAKELQKQIWRFFMNYCHLSFLESYPIQKI